MSSNPTPQTPATPPSGTAGQVRTWALVLAGIIVVKLKLDTGWTPIIALVLPGAVIALWSKLEKNATIKKFLQQDEVIEAAKIAIPTALALPSGSSLSTLARTLQTNPAAPIAVIPTVNTAPTATAQSVDTRPVMS
jgi:hypothetical protein